MGVETGVRYRDIPVVFVSSEKAVSEVIERETYRSGNVAVGLKLNLRTGQVGPGFLRVIIQ